ncbi:DUF397 domain-containing protein [Actinokineospora diospyrosa]|uniref:DUF397 domain-containing protein n=1 Tax=Actinokineospora diospyrosa TaxID=103728 RepID=A0ABT1IMI2_9PSEU|nr:DUF397 domain-containing protein [Actinokineospora diospyrosa]MCP2273868.1 protein of unknown function (DUF397) [Actinokineospora diospyrosa]
MAQTPWRKSSFSGGSGTSCVEVAWSDLHIAREAVLVRDSKNPAGPMLALPSSAWRGLLSSR